MSQKQLLTRQALQDGQIERLLHQGRHKLPIMSEEQRTRLVRTTLDQLDTDNGLWIFGYGSLIWNPALDFAEQRRCCVQGFRRKFCFWTTVSRGTEEHPGLMMGLVGGGQCHGVAYRIDADKAATELDIVFRREMVTFVYKPTWVETHCLESGMTMTALTFVVDQDNERYIHDLSRADTVKTLATAQGPLGRNCDYLFDLSRKLRELDFEDPELLDLEKQVIQYQAIQDSG